MTRTKHGHPYKQNVQAKMSLVWRPKWGATRWLMQVYPHVKIIPSQSLLQARPPAGKSIYSSVRAGVVGAGVGARVGARVAASAYILSTTLCIGGDEKGNQKVRA